MVPTRPPEPCFVLPVFDSSLQGTTAFFYYDFAYVSAARIEKTV